MTKYWTTLEDLYPQTQLSPSPELEKVSQEFQIKVSPTMQRQMAQNLAQESSNHEAKQNPIDPIERQFIPSIEELNILPEELEDPIGDRRFTPVEGIVHRYQDRALLKLTQLCEVYCRFCFRKEMIGQKGVSLTREELTAALQYIRETPELWEIILTGGDPLILSARRLEPVFKTLIKIPHIRHLRIHTRIPVVSPELISPALLTLIKESIDAGLAISVVLHANHAQEFSEEAKQALLKLRRTGALLLSQSVLLKGVNDNFEALSQLMYTFIEHGVKPYYLHQMDLARGTSHFTVDPARGKALIKALRKQVAGICVPSYIVEIPEGEGKRVLA